MTLYSSTRANESVSIRYDEVPSFLRNSAFYLQLAADDEKDGMLEVPRTYFKADDTVNDLEDFKLLLHTMVFWGLDAIPDSILDFCYDNDRVLWQDATVDLPINCSLRDILAECFDGTESLLPAVNIVHPEVFRHWIKVHPPESLLEPTLPCVEAASVGNFPLLQILHEYHYVRNEKVCEGAAQGGHLHCLKYLHEQGCPWDENACSDAAFNGHLDCLQYLYDHGCPWNYDNVCFAAAEQGKLSCLKFAHEQGGMLCKYVTFTQDIPCLRYALEQNCPVDEYLTSGMNLNGHSIETVKEFQEHGVVWAMDIVNASLECPLEYTQYLFRHGCRYDEHVVHDAVWYGTSQHLEYLLDEALLEMSDELYSEAVITGNLVCVQVLVDRGCPCNFTWHLDVDDFELCDERILLCIQYSTERSWACSQDLISFVFENSLPQCQQYLRNEGIIDSTIVPLQENKYNVSDRREIREISRFASDSYRDGFF